MELKIFQTFTFIFIIIITIIIIIIIIIININIIIITSTFTGDYIINLFGSFLGHYLFIIFFLLSF